MRVPVDDDAPAVLVDRARTGDEAAFASLYHRYAPMARRTAQLVVHDVHAAEDLAQEAFYHVLRAIRSGHGPKDSFAGYLQSTVRRLAYRYFANRGNVVIMDDAAGWEDSVNLPTQRTPQDDLVSAAWASLPPRWRYVLWLIDVDRYTPAELATSMAMTPSAVSSLASRARQALRTAYASVQRAP